MVATLVFHVDHTTHLPTLKGWKAEKMSSNPQSYSTEAALSNFTFTEADNDSCIIFTINSYTQYSTNTKKTQRASWRLAVVYALPLGR